MKAIRTSLVTIVAAAFAVTPSHAATLYWDGDQSIVDTASSNTSGDPMNWLSGGNWDNGTTSAAKATWTSGDIAIFGGTPVSQQTVTLSSGIQCGGMTIGNNYKISITGTGYNQLGNPSGAITINAGGILSADAASNNAHNIGTLTLNGGTLTASVTDNVAYGNWIFNNAGAGITVGGSSLSTISAYSIDVQTRTFTVNDAVAGAGTDLLVSANIRLGTLTKTGAGTMELTVANGYTGGTAINGGTLLVSGASGALGTGTITLGASGTLEFAASTNGKTISQNITGAGAIIKNGTGGNRYNFSGNNSGFTGTYTQTGAQTGFTSATAGSASAGYVLNGTYFVSNVGAATLKFGALSGSALHWNDSSSGTTTLEIGGKGIDTTFSGNIGSGTNGAATALTKTGAGKLTLSAGNSYGGATIINGGTLALTGSGTINNSSSITLAGGAGFDVSAVSFTLGSGKTLGGTGSVNGSFAVASGGIVNPGTAGSGTLTTNNNLTFNGTGTITIGALSGYTTNPALNVTGNLVLNGAAGAVTVNVPTASVANGTYHLIGHGNALTDLSKFTFAGGPVLGARQSGTYTNNATMVDYVVAGDLPYWTGALGNVWSTATLAAPKNWKLVTAGTTTDYIDGDVVLFNDNATGTTVVDISIGVAPVSTTFDNTSLNYTLQGSAGIATGSLSKLGTGALTINTANGFAGGSTLGGGTVTLGTSTALGTGSVTLNAGTLALNGQSIANALVLGGGAITGNGTISGIVSGGALSYDSSGNTLVLTGTNTYSGSTTITAGTLEIGGAGQLGAGSYAGTINNSGTMLVNASANQILSGAISGGGTLTKSGSGMLTLSTANNYTGATVINGGTLKLGNASALGGTGAGTQVNATGTLDLNGFSVGAETITLNGGTLGNSGGAEPGLGNVVLTADSHINITGAWINLRGATGTGKLTLNAASAISGVWNNTPGSTYANSGGIEIQSGSFDLYSTVKITGGPVAMGGGTLKTFGGDNISDSLAVTVNGGTWLMNAAETIGSLAGSGGTVNLQANTLTTGGSNTSTTYAGTITGTGGKLTKTGTGTLTLSGTNTYTGATTVNAGTMVINGNQTSATGAVTVNNSGTKLAGTGTIGGATTINSGAKYSAGAVGAVGNQTFKENLTFASGAIFEWDITSESTSSDFDTVTGSAGKTFVASGDFRVVTDMDFSTAFWNVGQDWTTIFNSFGTTTGWASLTSASVYDTSGTARDVSTEGSFSINGSTLTWTAVPEPTSALAGLVLGVGLLRRRREKNVQC